MDQESRIKMIPFSSLSYLLPKINAKMFLLLLYTLDVLSPSLFLSLKTGLTIIFP